MTRTEVKEVAFRGLEGVVNAAMKGFALVFPTFFFGFVLDISPSYSTF